MTISYRADLGALLAERLSKSEQRIRAMSVEQLFAIPQQDLVEDEMAYLSVERLAFDFDDMSALRDPRTSKQTQRDSWGDSVSVEVTEYALSIPFTGSAALIDHRPVGSMGGQFLSSPLPDATVSGSTVDVIIRTTGLNPTTVSETIRARLAVVQDWLSRQAGYANAYVESWESQTRQQLLQLIVTRQATLQTSSSVMTALGIPLAQSKSPVPVRRRPTPIRVATAKSPPSEQEYVLSDEIYDDIVQTISALGNAAERLPVTHQKLAEEDLRNVILFVLNANYEGLAVGEGFSGVGKTDILLVWKSRAAFIGECKIWHGEAALLQALDQLFGYTTWRDTRTAVIIFAAPESMSDVQTKARLGISKHAGFVREKSADRFIMKHPQDSEKRLTVSLLFVAAKLKDG